MWGEFGGYIVMAESLYYSHKTVTALLIDYQLTSVTQSCLTLCNTVDCSTPGLLVHHQLPEPTQTHVHRIHDAIQPSHPLLSPSPPTFKLSQHQGLFQWVGSSHQVAQSTGVSASASVLPVNIQDWFPWFSWLDLLAVQGTLKSLLQHHSSKASILQRSAFFISPALISILDYWKKT